MILSAHMTDAPEPVTKYRESVPLALAQLVNKCLEKKPADRWQSAEELLPQLEALVTPSGGMTPTGTIPARNVRGARRGMLTGVGGTLGIVAAVVVGWWFLSGRGATTANEMNGRIPIVVLAFDSRGAGDDAEAFSEGIADDIATQLSKISGFAVKAPASARRLSVDTMSYGEIAALLGVDYLVHGTWDLAGDDLRVTARLIHPETEEQRWVEDYNRQWAATNIFDIRSDVARQVAAALDLQLTPEEQAQLAVQPTENTEAYNAYQLGRFFWNKRTHEGIRRSIDYFNEAIAADSSFALAYVGLADGHLLLPWYATTKPMEAFPAAHAAALRALAIDSTLGEAYASLALVRQYEWDLEGSRAAFRRAIVLSPDYATARQWYGTYLVWVGQIDEGVAETRRALELDPVSVIINSNLVEALLAADQVDEAVEQYDRLHTLSSTTSRSLLGWAYLADNRLDDALTVFDEAGHDVGRMHVYARMEDWDRVFQLYEQLEQRVREDSRQQWVTGFFMAGAALAVGDTNRTFELLERAVEERDPRLADMSFRAPRWAGLWSHNRFRALINSMGLDLVEGRLVQIDGEAGH
jgi:TolB-like protein